MKTPTRSITRTLGFILVLGATALYAGKIGPDAKGYTATDAAPFSFVDISSTGIGVLGGSDDSAAIVQTGFAFRFYDGSYTSVCISTNGLLAFGGCNSDFANLDLTSTAVPGNLPLIAPFWTDLTFDAPGANAVYYQTLGSPGSRRFVVQWNNAFPVNATNGVTFQVILQESSNNIVFQYKDVEAGAGSPANAGLQSTVGIRDAGGEVSNRRLQWSYNAPVLHNDEAIVFVSDTTAPVIVPQISGTAGANGWYVGDVTVSWNVSDPESGIQSRTGCNSTELTSDSTGTLLQCNATNGAGLSASASVNIKLDKTLPVLSGMPVSCQLWPPDDRWVQVAVISASDTTSGLGPFTVTATSSEPERAGRGPDIVITRVGSRYSVQLRAFRAGTVADRTYTITAAANDIAGNVQTATASCIVPHDQR